VQHRVHLELPDAATVTDALAAVRRVPPFDGLDLAGAEVGVFGVTAGRDQILEHGDRLEIYRPLLMDPKEARRQRAKARDPE
jgi:putative ubiquitin-RnfH superfamily antitoxin RatB of RatAB toxin-antitoxin module